MLFFFLIDLFPVALACGRLRVEKRRRFGPGACRNHIGAVAECGRIKRSAGLKQSLTSRSPKSVFGRCPVGGAAAFPRRRFPIARLRHTVRMASAATTYDQIPGHVAGFVHRAQPCHGFVRAFVPKRRNFRMHCQIGLQICFSWLAWYAATPETASSFGHVACASANANVPSAR